MIAHPEPSEFQNAQLPPGRLEEIADEYPEFHELVVQHQNCPLPLKAWIFDHKPALRESEERRLALLQNGPQGQPGALPAPADAAEARRRERKAAQDARKEKRRVEQLARRAAIGAEHHPAVSVDTGAVPANSSQRPGILSTARRVLFVLLALLALGRCTGVIGGGDESAMNGFVGTDSDVVVSQPAFDGFGQDR